MGSHSWADAVDGRNWQTLIADFVFLEWLIGLAPAEPLDHYPETERVSAGMVTVGKEWLIPT